jgi:predicted RNase H-like nuclease
MTDRPVSVGAHWCGESWLGVTFGPTGFRAATVYDEVGELWLRNEDDADCILVDVPVGLLEGGDPVRECDRRARELLGDRARAVVDPPVREAVRKRNYSAATRVNERTVGEGVSERAFALSPAIAAVDELLRELPEARPVVAASHPEVCFRAFAGEPLAHPRSTAAGYAERMRTLAGVDRDAPPVVQSVAEATGDAEVSVPDVLDAVVLAYAAGPGEGDLHTLPADPPTDPAGLPVAIAYRAPAPLE